MEATYRIRPHLFQESQQGISENILDHINTLLLVVFPFVLFLAGNYLSGPSLPITVARYTIFASILIGSILVFFRMLVLWKRLFFKADLQASALVGKESLLLSLKKIASIDQSNHRSRKGFVRPSVDERINHLTNSTPQDQP